MTVINGTNWGFDERDHWKGIESVAPKSVAYHNRWANLASRKCVPTVVCVSSPEWANLDFSKWEFLISHSWCGLGVTDWNNAVHGMWKSADNERWLYVVESGVNETAEKELAQTVGSLFLPISVYQFEQQSHRHRSHCHFRSHFSHQLPNVGRIEPIETNLVRPQFPTTAYNSSNRHRHRSLLTVKVPYPEI